MRFNRKKLEQRAGTFAFKFLLNHVERKDALGAERFGIRLGRFIYRISKKHRNRALSNLAMAMPELTDSERQDICRRMFEHFGIVGADFLRSRKRTHEEVLESVEMEGFPHVLEALAQDKGVIVVTGHFGNWERVGHYSTARGYKMYVVAREANDSALNSMVAELRAASGLEVESRGNAARAILRLLGQKQMVAILPDQNSEEIFVPFFGLPTGTVQGPAVLHERTGAPIITAFCARTGPVKYRLVISPPLQKVEGYDGPEGMTRAINNALEDIIRQYPEQWLWLHDRWKSARRRGLV